MIGNMASLVSAEAPRWSSDLERTTFTVTLPASLLSLLVRSRDEDSIIFWSGGALVWVAGVFAQFSILATLPRYMRRRPVHRQIALIVALIIFGVSLLWLASSWPQHRQEEPVLFFIRVPLWFLTASTILFVLVWSPWYKHGAGDKTSEQ